MVIRYMKKYRWVILTLLLAVAIFIVAVYLLAPPAAEQEFHGTFIRAEGVHPP